MKQYKYGTHRTCDPAKTLSNLKPLLSELGITRVANITGLDHIGIPVVQAIRPNSRSISVSQGKGLTMEAATVSAIMESLEGWHAEHISLPLMYGSYSDLSQEDNLVVEGLIRKKKQWHPDVKMLWVKSKQQAWLPYECVSLDYTQPLPNGSGYFPLTSNGLASGNSPEEAKVHAICELIERDAVTLHSLKSAEEQVARRVNNVTIHDVAARDILAKYLQAGVDVGIWDVTSDVGIPAFRAIVVDKNPDRSSGIGPVEGMGCHLDKGVALCRALTEAAQGRLTMISGARDDNNYEAYKRFSDTKYLDAAKDWVGYTGDILWDSIPSFENESHEMDLIVLYDNLEAAGLKNIYSFDLTSHIIRDEDLYVKRVVIPGLETYHHVRDIELGYRAKAVQCAN